MEAEADSNEALLDFLYACPIGLIEIDGTGAITMINPHAMKHLMPIAGAHGVANLFSVLEHCAPELRNMFDAHPGDHGTVCERHRIAVDLRRERVTDTLKVLECTLVKIGRERSIVTLSDITVQVESERKLRLAETWFGSLLSGVNDYAVLAVTPEGLIGGVSASFTRQTGHEFDSICGRSLQAFFDGDDQSSSVHVADQLRISARDGWSLDEHWQRRRNGEKYWCQCLFAAQMNQDAVTPSGYLVVLRDVDHQSSDTAELRRMLTRDHLTGAVNRTHFLLQAQYCQTRWDSMGEPFSLVLIDIDHFKGINDRYGHPTGDAVLQGFTTTCMGVLRKDDVFARLGGEEFAVLLPSASLVEALSVAELLRETLAETQIAIPSGFVSITGSFGCSTASRGERGVDEMIKLADECLYAAKRAGRNRVCGPSDALAAA